MTQTQWTVLRHMVDHQGRPPKHALEETLQALLRRELISFDTQHGKRVARVTRAGFDLVRRVDG